MSFDTSLSYAGDQANNILISVQTTGLLRGGDRVVLICTSTRRRFDKSQNTNIRYGVHFRQSIVIVLRLYDKRFRFHDTANEIVRSIGNSRHSYEPYDGNIYHRALRAQNEWNVYETNVDVFVRAHAPNFPNSTQLLISSRLIRTKGYLTIITCRRFKKIIRPFYYCNLFEIREYFDVTEPPRSRNI